MMRLVTCICVLTIVALCAAVVPTKASADRTDVRVEVEKRLPRRELPKEAKSVMLTFQQTLKEFNWERALSYCSKKVKTKAAEYGSIETFFTDVLPIEEIISLPEFRVSGRTTRNDKVTSYRRNIELKNPNSKYPLDWGLSVRREDSNWVVEFPTKPLDIWLKHETLKMRHANGELKFDKEKIREGFDVRLVPLSTDFVTGSPMLFRLEMKNISNETLGYLKRPAMVNNPMTVKYLGGDIIPYMAGSAQVAIGPEFVEPNETIVLADNYDIRSQYHIVKPGRYTFQFNGKGYMKPSNIVEIDIKSGQLSTLELIVEKLISVLPKDWTLTRTRIRDIADFDSETDRGMFVHMVGKRGRKGTSGGTVGVFILINPTQSVLEKTEFEAEFWGQSQWGPVYVKAVDAELLWPNYKEQIINTLNIQMPNKKPDVQVEVERREAGSMAARVEVQSQRQSVIRAVDNKATLRSGVSIELVGLTYIPAKGQPWWKYDGSPVDEPPFERVGTDPSVDPNWEQFNYYAVTMRLKGKPAAKMGQVKWLFRRADGHAHTTYYHKNVLAGLVRFPKYVKTTTLRLGIAGGQWETLIAFKDYGSYGKGKDSIAVSKPYGPYGPLGSGLREKGLYIRVVYNVTDRDVRIVAVDKNGKVHLSSSGGSGGTSDLRRTIANFRDLTQDKLQEYRFEVREYEWVEFRNIALRPGKEAITRAERKRAIEQEKLEQWLGEGQTRRIRKQILTLRESYHIHEPCNSQVAAISAIQELVGIGAPAVPELITELRQTERWLSKSLIAFTLRAIGDRRAVPALIEVLGRSKYRGECGVYVKDDELASFMLEHQHRPPDDDDRKAKQVIIAGPVVEIVKALDKITGHSEGPEMFSPEAAEAVKRRWQRWWQQQNKQKTDVQVEAPVEAALGWLKLIDDGDYGKSFDEMAALYKGAVSKARWEETMDHREKGFGKVVSRKVSSTRHTRYLPTGPVGQYVIIEFESSFEHTGKAAETVTLMRDRDGVWRVANYFIK